MRTLFEVFLCSLKLGLISFGGPSAHMAHFYREYVEKRAWISLDSFKSLQSLCQILPGPASSQLSMAIGMFKAGPWGALSAFIGFTSPTFVALVLLAQSQKAGWGFLDQAIHGLKIAAWAIVAHALYQMIPKWIQTKSEYVWILFSALLSLWNPWNPLWTITLFALLGAFILKPTLLNHSIPSPHSRSFALLCLGLLLLLIGLWSWLEYHPGTVLWQLFALHSKVGTLVFGGGHVVLALLSNQKELLQWMSQDQILSGYALCQMLPGPLFTLSAYLGALAHGWSGALVACIGIFLPGYLMLAVALPFWQNLQQSPKLRSACQGLGLCVLGLLGALWIQPLGTGSIHNLSDMLLGLGLLALLGRNYPIGLILVLALTYAYA